MKALFLIVGLVVGGAIGWFTAPAPAVDIKVGPVSVQVQGDAQGGSVSATDTAGGGVQVAVGNPGFLADRNQRTGVFAVIGGILGLGMGFLAGRRGRS